MYCLVTGSRDWDSIEAIRADLETLPPHTVVLHGACPSGADAIAEAEANRLGLLTQPFPADWSKGKKAGPIRNHEMVKFLSDRVSAGADYVAFAYKQRTDSADTDDCINKLRARALDFETRHAKG